MLCARGLSFHNRHGPGFGFKTIEGKGFYIVMKDDKELTKSMNGSATPALTCASPTS